MLLERKSSWVDLVTGISVVLSLVFVGWQIHGTTKAVRGATLQGITDETLELNSLLITVTELRTAMEKAERGRSDFSPEEREVLSTWYASLLRVTENRFRQTQLGTFSGTNVVAGARSPALRIPYFRAYWNARRTAYAPDFQRYVERELLPLVEDSLSTVHN